MTIILPNSPKFSPIKVLCYMVYLFSCISIDKKRALLHYCWNLVLFYILFMYSYCITYIFWTELHIYNHCTRTTELTLQLYYSYVICTYVLVWLHEVEFNAMVRYMVIMQELCIHVSYPFCMPYTVCILSKRTCEEVSCDVCS